MGDVGSGFFGILLLASLPVLPGDIHSVYRDRGGYGH
jgi:hypothetical protein